MSFQLGKLDGLSGRVLGALGGAVLPAAIGLSGQVAALSGNEAWYRANEGQTVTGLGVSQWDDKSGNARNLLQATDLFRPALESDGSVTFSGVGQWLGAAFTSLAEPYTIYVCGFNVTWVPNGSMCGCATAGPPYSAIYNNGPSGTPAIRMFQTADGTENTAFALGVKAIVIATFNGAASLLGVNAGAEVNGDPGTGTLAGGFFLGQAAGTTYGNVRVYEALVRSGADSAATKSLIRSYLANKYGISL